MGLSLGLYRAKKLTRDERRSLAKGIRVNRTQLRCLEVIDETEYEENPSLYEELLPYMTKIRVFLTSIDKAKMKEMFGCDTDDKGCYTIDKDGYRYDIDYYRCRSPYNDCKGICLPDDRKVFFTRQEHAEIFSVKESKTIYALGLELLRSWEKNHELRYRISEHYNRRIVETDPDVYADDIKPFGYYNVSEDTFNDMMDFVNPHCKLNFTPDLFIRETY